MHAESDKNNQNKTDESINDKKEIDDIDKDSFERDILDKLERAQHQNNIMLF